ncbi:hypothetical protein CB1_000350031 [Camelus ferus]|nr:hypothetical protein CB1_000350031 [Camelus ferus]
MLLPATAARSARGAPGVGNRVACAHDFQRSDSESQPPIAQNRVEPLTPSAFWAEDVARNSPGLLASSLREARPHIPVSGTTLASLCGLSCEEKLGKQAQIRLGFAILHGMDESTEVQRGSVNCKWQPRISEKARLSLGAYVWKATPSHVYEASGATTREERT